MYAGFDLSRSGLVIAGYPGEAAVVEGNSTRTNTIEIRNATDVAIMNLTVQDSSVQYGAAIDASAVSNLSVAGNVLRNNQSFGINLENVSNSVIKNNDISGNGTGIEIEYGGSGTVIQYNLIHDNLTLVDSGRGKDGINVYFTTLPTLINNNILWNNGTSFELYNSSNLTFTQNLAYDGSVLETGTDPGGSCDHITFTRNLAWKSPTLNRYADGLILRCASHSLIANNTFDGLDAFAFDVIDGTLGTEFGGSIEGLTIENNIVVNGRAYSIDTVLPASVVIDHNLGHGTSNARYGAFFAYVAGHGNTTSLADFQSWTGYDMHGLSADPLFVDQAARNYHLTAASPAIDQGTILSDPYNGAAPDLGRYEYP